MSEYTHTPIGSGYNANSAINTELSSIEAVINNKLSKSGGAMSGDIDLDSNDLLNVKSVSTEALSINGVQLTSSGAVTTTLPAQMGHSGKILTTDGSTASWVETGATTTLEATVSAMATNTNRAYTVGDVVRTTEFSSGNGGGGVYDTVLTSSVTPNGFDIIQGVTDTTISFVLRVGDTLKSSSFGAVGDGTTNQAPAIQAMLDRAQSGDTCVIEEGDSYYLIDATQLSEALTVNSSIKVVVDGELRGTTFTNQANPPYTMNVTANGVIVTGRGKFSGDGTFVLVTSDNAESPGYLRIAADNVIVDGCGSLLFERPPQIGIYNIGGDNVAIKNCLFTGGVDSISGGIQHFCIRYEGPTKGGSISGNSFDSYDATHHNVTNIALLGAAHSETVIEGNRAYSQLDQIIYANLINSSVANNLGGKGDNSVTGQGIKINSGNGIVVSNNQLSCTDTNIQLINVSETVCDGNVITGFSTGWGINIYDNTGVGAAMNNIIVSNNVIKGDVTGAPSSLHGGIDFNPNVDSANLKIVNNTLTDCGYSDTSTSAGGIVVQPNSGITLTGCQISGNSISGSLGRYGISAIRVDALDLVNNTVKFEASSATAPLRGVNLATVDGVRLLGNTIDNTLSGTLSMDFGFLTSSTNNIRNEGNTVLGWDGVSTPWPFAAGNLVTVRGNMVDDNEVLSGQVTLGAAANTVVANTNIASATRTDNSIAIRLTPVNTSAATLVGSASSPYVSALTPQASFTISTADGTAASGTEVFQYEIIQ